MLDAYTIRKIVPRLAMAVIGVNLSIYLCIAAVDITNVVGGGLGHLIREPFIESGSFNSLGIEKNALNGIVGVVGAGALGSLVGASIGLGLAGEFIIVGLLMLLLAAVIVVLVAIAILATLVIRYGAILLLTIVSPVAIACLVLPGTEKYFKQWWDLFLKTLLVYPIIAAIFAISDVLGAILLSTQNSVNNITSLVSVFVVLAAMYAPLFMIPFSFKMAGGFLGNVYDFLNTQGVNRAREGLKKWREDPESMWARRTNRLKNQKYEKGFTAKQIASGTFSGAGSMIRGKGLSGFRSSYRANSQEIGSKKALHAAKEAKEREFYEMLQGDNDASQVLMDAIQSGDFSDEALASNLMAQDNDRFGGRVDEHGNAIADNQDQIDRRNQYMSMIRGIHSQLGDQAGSIVGAREIGEASTGFRDTGVVGQYQAARQAGGESKILQQVVGGNLKESAKKNKRGDTGAYSASASHAKIARLEDAGVDDVAAQARYRAEQWSSSLDKASPAEIATWDSNTFTAMNDEFTEAMSQAYTISDPAEREKAIQAQLSNFNALQQAMTYSPSEIRRELGDKIFSQQIKHADGSVASKVPDMQRQSDGSYKAVGMKDATVREMLEATRMGQRPAETYKDRSGREYDPRNPDGTPRG